MDKLTEFKEPWNDKFNDNNDQLRKWLAGASVPYPGDALPVHHFLSIKASDTDLVYKDSESITRSDIRTLNWLFAPLFDIRALGQLPARWLARDTSCVKALLLLLEHGGLSYTGESHPHESCLNLEIGIAAKKVTKVILLPEDVIMLDNPQTNTWMDEVITKDVTPSDGSARAYFQFRNATGHFLSRKEAQEMIGIFKDIPYKMLKLCGDIQNLEPDVQAQLILKAFAENVEPDGMDMRPKDYSRPMGEFMRRIGDSPYNAIFMDRAFHLYPILEKLGSRDGVRDATALEAKQGVFRAATTLNIERSAFDSVLVGAVLAAIGPHVDDAVSDDKHISIEERMCAAASAAKALANGQARPSGGDSDKFASSDASWIEASDNPDFKQLVAELEKHNLSPPDLRMAASVLMQHKSPAGLIFMAGTRVPPTKILKDLSQARAPSVVHAAMNTVITVDRTGTPHPEWGAPVSPKTCQRTLNGNWVTFSTLKENTVMVSSDSIRLFEDVVMPVIIKEDGVQAAAHIAKLSDGSALSVFRSALLLRRSMPILRAWLKAVGINGTGPFSWAGLIQNALNRLEVYEPLPPSQGRQALMQCILYACALALEEGQQGYKIIFAGSVANATRTADFWNPSGAAHATMKQADTLWERQKQIQVEAAFAIESPGQSSARPGNKRLQGYEGYKGTDPKQQKSWGYNRHLLAPTEAGGWLFAGNERIEPANPQKSLRGVCPATLVKLAHPEKSWFQTFGWCNDPKCKMIYEKEGRDPHDPAASGIAPTDIVVTQYGPGDSGEKRWAGAKGSQRREGGANGGGKGWANGKGGGKGNSGAGTSGGGGAGKGSKGGGNGKGKGAFKRQGGGKGKAPPNFHWQQ